MIMLFSVLTNGLRAQNPFTIPSPGFEGTVAQAITPTGWVACRNTPDTQDGSLSGTSALPFQGNTYLGIHALPNFDERAAAVLTSPMQPGQPYEFSMYLTIAGLNIPQSTLWNAANQGHNPGVMRLYGGLNSCGPDTLLWESPTISPGAGWTRVSVKFTPNKAYTHLVFIPAAAPGGSGLAPYMGVDALEPPQPSSSVPTLSQWGLIMLALLVLCLGGVYIRRRAVGLSA